MLYVFVNSALEENKNYTIEDPVRYFVGSDVQNRLSVLLLFRYWGPLEEFPDHIRKILILTSFQICTHRDKNILVFPIPTNFFVPTLFYDII